MVLTSKEVEDLERQANTDGITVTDCIRRSLELGRIAWEAQRYRRGRLLLESPDGEKRVIELPRRGRD